MIKKIKSLIFGKNKVEIRTARMANEEISFFQVKHPFLTAKEVTILCAELYDFFLKNKNELEKKRLVFEEKPSLISKLLTLISKKNEN